MTPTVSIVIPTYNNAADVEATMRSVLDQTYDDTEVIVADHASVDDTWQLLQQFADHPKVSLLRTPSGGGARRNWQAVSDAATGELLKLVCADDILYPTCLSEQVAALQAAPSAVLTACARDIVDANGAIVVRSRGLGGMQGVVDGRRAVRRTVRLGTNIFGEPACVLMRRAALIEVGGWDDAFPFLIDQATYSRLLMTGDFVALPRTLAAFRVSATQWSVRLASAQAGQAAGLHRALHRQHPDVISPADVAQGNARATATALMRRTAYIYLRRRMLRTAHGSATAS